LTDETESHIQFGQPMADPKPQSGKRRRNGAVAAELKAPWRAYMAEHHLKASKVRDVIVDVFLGLQGRHVDLAEVHREVKKHNPRIALASVYRALKLLEQAGIAESRHFSDKSVSYEIKVGREHLDHLICE
jgi:Fe2+ or Zn2+ uptake regulation protein